MVDSLDKDHRALSERLIFDGNQYRRRYERTIFDGVLISAAVTPIIIASLLLNYNIIYQPMYELISVIKSNNSNPSEQNFFLSADAASKILNALETFCGILFLDFLGATEVLRYKKEKQQRYGKYFACVMFLFMTLFAYFEVYLSQLRNFQYSMDAIEGQIRSGANLSGIGENASALANWLLSQIWQLPNGLLLLSIVMPFTLMLAAIPLEVVFQTIPIVSRGAMVAGLAIASRILRLLLFILQVLEPIVFWIISVVTLLHDLLPRRIRSLGATR